MKIRSIATLLSVIILGAALCACGSSEGKSAYRPPAEIFGVTISGTSEPQIDGVKFTYDSKARIDTVTFTYDGYEYKQQYSYDTDQVVIKTIYETKVIEEKVIKYVDIPIESGFTTIEGYYIRATKDMSATSASNDTDSQTLVLSDLVETAIDEDSPKTNDLSKAHFCVPKIKLESNDVSKINGTIMSIYQTCYDSAESYSISYEADLYDHYLSVVLSIVIDQSDYFDFVAFTVDVDTKKQLNASEILCVFSINESTFDTEMKSAESKGFKYSENYSKELTDLFIWKGKLMVLGMQELMTGDVTYIYDYQERDYNDALMNELIRKAL